MAKDTPATPASGNGKPKSMFSLRQRQREATQEPFVFDVDGELFTMKPVTAADWQVAADLAAGEVNLRDLLRELLGEEDYERFCVIKGISPEDIGALIEAATRHYQGVGQGE